MNVDKITQSYLDIFPFDVSENPMQRQTPGFLGTLAPPYGFKKAQLLAFNQDLSNQIGLGNLETEDEKYFLIAKNIPPHLKPYATAYAGHQFGQWAGQLGDGRAIFAGEISNGNKTYELQWKGAGATPYSRHADGRAVLRSSIREYLMSEAMYHLGIPTTRALSLGLTGEKVARDILYNGNVDFEQGAVMMRVAESFLRFGHFELFSARKEFETLRKLADFAIQHYFPEIQSSGKEKYAEFLEKIAHQTAELIVEWYRVGFTHGVMNTDNMSILGLSIDFGPFSMLDEYDLNFTSNTTDLPGKRYAFGKQAEIAHWNLIQLAVALHPLIEDEVLMEEILHQFGVVFWKKYDEMMAKKFGFGLLKKDDQKIFDEWQNLFSALNGDYTLFFQQLESVDFDTDILKHFQNVFYTVLNDEQKNRFSSFIIKYLTRISENDISREKSRSMMQKSNPKFVLRNYLLYECIAEVEGGKMDLFHQLSHALENPYEEVYPKFSQKRPSRYDGIAGCSALSCSS